MFINKLIYKLLNNNINYYIKNIFFLIIFNLLKYIYIYKYYDLIFTYII